jgi:NADH:ubiquinone reductase (H+-translocating)
MNTSATQLDVSDSMAPARHRVVIVGGGFGGVYAARALRRSPVVVTLIDRRNFHTFSPMLYQAATGAVAPSEVSQPLRTMLRRQRNASVILGEVTELDADARQLRLSDGTSLGYDSLIVATGTQPSYFGHEAWREHAPGLKTLEDATEMRRRALLAFEAAERETDADRRRAWMTLVVVGGGPTGVELAGALAELARETMRSEFRAIDPRGARVVLIEAVDEILPGWPEFLRSSARHELEELGVEIRTGTRVEEVGPTHVHVRAGAEAERIDTRTAFWAAGVRPSAFGRRVARALAAPTDRVGRIVVEPDLSVVGHPEVFVVGDLAAIQDANGEPVPDVAQKGIQGGRHAARVITERLRDRPTPSFRYRDIGDLAMIGRFRTVARLPFLALTGFVAWVLWLGIHLYYLNGIQTRLLVSVRWLWTLFSSGRGSRLITGSHATYGALPPIGSLDGAQDLPGVEDRPAA